MVDFKEIYSKWPNIRLGKYSNRCTTGFNFCTIIFIYIYIYIYIYTYINDLTDNLNDNVKLFADDTSLFLKICDNLGTANVLDNDLNKIRKWAEQRKMVYNPGATTKPQEIPKTFRTQTRPKAEF